MKLNHPKKNFSIHVLGKICHTDNRYIRLRLFPYLTNSLYYFFIKEVGNTLCPECGTPTKKYAIPTKIHLFTNNAAYEVKRK